MIRNVKLLILMAHHSSKNKYRFVPYSWAVWQTAVSSVFSSATYLAKIEALPTILATRDRRDQKFWYDTDTDTFSGSESILILIPILEIGLNRDWYWYQENCLGLILIPRLYFIRILPIPYKNCPSLCIDTRELSFCWGGFYNLGRFLQLGGRILQLRL